MTKLMYLLICMMKKASPNIPANIVKCIILYMCITMSIYRHSSIMLLLLEGGDLILSICCVGFALMKLYRMWKLKL